jgi:outer membrane protein assembly factor BamB
VVGGVAHPGNACKHPAAASFPATGLDLATGRPRWHAPTAAGAVLAASPGIVIAAGTSPGCLVGLDPTTGKIRWTVAPPVVPYGLGIAGTIAAGDAPRGKSLLAVGLDAGTGKTRWKTALPIDDAGVSPLAVGDAAAVAPLAHDPDFTLLTGLATATGRRLWRDSVQAYQTWTTIGPGILLITRLSNPDRDQATIEARDPRTGVRRWQSGDIGGVGLPVTDGATIVTYSQGSAKGFAAADGHQLWTVSGAYEAAAVTADGAYLAQPKHPKNEPEGGGGD